MIDNVIVAQEIIHSLQKKTGRSRGMVVKIDLEKAYDRVSWPFLREVLKVTRFSPHLTELIMSCIMSTTLTVLWNGQKLNVI